MSTATNGAATEAAFTAITEATKDAGTAVVAGTASIGTASIGTASIGTASVGPSVENAGGKATEASQAWLEATKTITHLSLDAYDASVRAYLDYSESIAAASKATWAIELAQSNNRIMSDLAVSYSSAARDLFAK